MGRETRDVAGREEQENALKKKIKDKMEIAIFQMIRGSKNWRKYGEMGRERAKKELLCYTLVQISHNKCNYVFQMY